VALPDYEYTSSPMWTTRGHKESVPDTLGSETSAPSSFYIYLSVFFDSFPSSSDACLVIGC